MAHGGAWKVAYADFVTAMMALFMVLWICAQDKKILIATSKYFQNPFHSPLDSAAGVIQSKNSRSSPKPEKESGSEKDARDKQIAVTFLNSVAAEFYRLLNLDVTLKEKPIDIQVTSDGLRVTLFDRAKQPVFVGDTTEFTEWGRFVMQSMAWTIDRHRFRVTIDGHTRAGVVARDDYSAWELSADRANAARRCLVHFAVEGSQVERVTGFADTMPIAGEQPESESNQRLTLGLALSAKSKNQRPVEKALTARAPVEPAPKT